MQQIFRSAVLAAMLVAGTHVWAQTDDSATQDSETAQELQEEFQTAEELAENAPGSAYIRETHGDWEMRCLRAEEGQPEECRLYQLLRDQESPVAEFSLQVLPEGGKAVAGVEFATPLGTLLTANVVMRIDGGNAKQYPYSWCDQLGCYSRFGLTAGEIDAMKKGAVGNMRIVSIASRDKPIELGLSLTGFTAAFNALSVHQAEAAAPASSDN